MKMFISIYDNEFTVKHVQGSKYPFYLSVYVLNTIYFAVHWNKSYYTYLIYWLCIFSWNFLLKTQDVNEKTVVSKLSITDLSKDDGGQYTCEAATQNAPSDKKNIYLVVKCESLL